MAEAFERIAPRFQLPPDLSGGQIKCNFIVALAKICLWWSLLAGMG